MPNSAIRQPFPITTTVSAPGSSQNLLIPSAGTGTWYFLVYAESVLNPGDFTLQASASSIVLTGVTPTQYGANVGAVMTLTGAGFTNGVTISLVSSDGTTTYYPASSEVETYTQMTATFDLTKTPQGIYSVRVASPSGDSDQLLDAFTVTPAGQAVLETNLVVPSWLGRHALPPCTSTMQTPARRPCLRLSSSSVLQTQACCRS